jgi:uncharacterized protein YozE (UPF0346 family)
MNSRGGFEMTFYTYMTRKHIDDDTPMGDLARDMKEDKEKFPRNENSKIRGWHGYLYNYLCDHGACGACLDTFDEAWEEYVKWVRSRRNGN